MSYWFFCPGNTAKKVEKIVLDLLLVVSRQEIKCSAIVDSCFVFAFTGGVLEAEKESDDTDNLMIYHPCNL